MSTRIVYFDETGDDGLQGASCDHFLLTGIYMSADSWQVNYESIRILRRQLKDCYGFHTSHEFHTKAFLTDKTPYRDYGWTVEQKQQVLDCVVDTISRLDARVVNVIIDKTRCKRSDYHVLENALTYSLQRIENDSNGEWNYLVITDKGRLSPMRRTARAIRVFNPIPSKYNPTYINAPLKGMIEDILEKDSKESYFIQACDFVSYFVHLYFVIEVRNAELPNRVACVIDKEAVHYVMNRLKAILNLKATASNEYGIVIYPK